ncbi:hypothetical protein FSP39_009438 [Pinctada imbricata]|uniref:EGF-like domain-containing protein n=1 Tax=Pinctada imbricata TaxID=66713 RepID=A0AA88YBT9_PINIB|nr:hypothetical protein FSP39_009438 [Pinctada imbricata]
MDECSLGSSGCDQLCINSDGSFTCSCRTGYNLLSDRKTCYGVNQCTENNGGCDHTCLSTDGKHECRCHKGFRLNSDGKTCQDTDECIQIKGLCNGDCVNTPGSYKCNCLAGFMSTNNETRCHNIDDCLDNKCANSAICDDGIEGYTCRCVGGYTGSYCETESSSIAYPLIPVGCHTIVIPVNQEGHLHNLTLVSTTPWYSKMANNKTTGTSGIVSVKGTLSTFPLSLFGAEVNQLNGQITSYMNDGNLNFSNTKSIEVLSKDCASSHPSPSQIFEMTRNHSFLYTFLSSLDHSKPSWIDFESTDRSIPDILDAKSEILSGRDIDSIYHCKDVPVFDDRMYAVNLFSSALNLKVLNDMIKFSKQDRENKFCVIRDIGINDASVFLNIPKDAQLSILPYQLFSTLYQLFGIEIYLNGIGVSVADGIKPDENIFEATLWNGDHFFTFRPFSSSDIWITGESTIDVFGGIIDMKGDITVYISVPDPNTLCFCGLIVSYPTHLASYFDTFLACSISQLIRYARASTKYTDFVLRARRLSDKLLSQGYVCDRLTSSLRKFYGLYWELVIHYDVPLSRMVDDILS